MALDHLLRDAPRDVLEAKPAPLGSERREKEDLEEQVAELAPQRLGITAVDRLERFVTFLEKEGPDGLRRLLPVPRALAPQALDERARRSRASGRVMAAILFRGDRRGTLRRPTC